MLKKLLFSFWIISLLALFLYSFVQVDLGLTLTRASYFQVVQKSFQYVGYFNRPLSSYLSGIIFTVLFIMYVLTLILVFKKKITGKIVWRIVFFAGFLLLFSYNAFSYDLFNYIFDAKIVTHYFSNPYVHKALDYPQDPMLGFMHWTHRTYPYGPVWLGLTIPLSFLGFGYFFLTFFLFKSLMLASYLLSSLMIERIARKTKIIDPVYALAFFALNPFVIIESLVSAHNDIVMMGLSLAAVYFLIERKLMSAFIFLLLSIGIKFATVLLLPIFIAYIFLKNRQKDSLLFFSSICVMLVAVYLASARTTFQPWYFLLALPFISFFSKKYFISVPVILFSYLILFQYIPYFYNGNYDPPIPQVMNELLWGSVMVSVVSGVLIKAVTAVKK